MAQPEGPVDRVDHHTPESHRCGECRHWVVDCDHVVSPLPVAHVAVNDGWMRSLSYDRRHSRLEIEFRWNERFPFVKAVGAPPNMFELLVGEDFIIDPGYFS